MTGIVLSKTCLLSPADELAGTVPLDGAPCPTNDSRGTGLPTHAGGRFRGLESRTGESACGHVEPRLVPKNESTPFAARKSVPFDNDGVDIAPRPKEENFGVRVKIRNIDTSFVILKTGNQTFEIDTLRHHRVPLPALGSDIGAPAPLRAESSHSV